MYSPKGDLAPCKSGVVDHDSVFRSCPSKPGALSEQAKLTRESQSATLTTDALLSTGFAGSAQATTAPTTAAAAAPAAATGPINSATLTTDALISTGGNQAPTNIAGQAATATLNAAAQTHAVGPLMAGLGAFAAAVVIL